MLVIVVLIAILSCVLVQSGSEQFTVFEATIPEIQKAMTRGTITAVELVDAYIARINAYDQHGPHLNAIIRINPNARAEAAGLDAERQIRGPRGLLHGIPVILKDNYNTSDIPTTGGSIALAGFIPSREAFQVRKLREAGAIILAKSNLHELAMGITTISSLGGQTRNPYDLTRNPGGSSGGTGAAIAASYASVGMGTSTCGSIRIPAALNNLVGLRPTKGLSSIAGIMPLSHTQDTAGPLARTVTDLAVVLDATIGFDPDDPATRVMKERSPLGFTAALDTNALKGTRLGKLSFFFGNSSEEQAVNKVVNTAIDDMNEQGAGVMEVTIPGLDSLLANSDVIRYEFKFDLIDYLTSNPGAPINSLSDILNLGLYHIDLHQRFQKYNTVSIRNSADYQAALAWRAILRDLIVQVMDDHQLDALIYPTIRHKASRIGESQLGATCQLSANSGLPALTVPAGFTDDGLPVGIEFLGKPFSDPKLVAMGFAFEQTTRHRRPPAVTPPLIEGHAPAPITVQVRTTGEQTDSPKDSQVTAEARFTFDTTRNTLTYTVHVSGVPDEEIHAVCLHRGKSGHGPVIARLSGLGVGRAEGSIKLPYVDRQALLNGELFVKVYTQSNPTAAAQGRLMLPK
jgi:Asp-tRNA(Asn)/Glu-tRNA(Gln) amidotransferase A subunit family amidase